MSRLEKKLWNPKLELLPRKELKQLQWERLKRQLEYNYHNSIYYREEKFHKVGLTPDKIKSWDDFRKIPLFTKDEHRRVQEESIRRFGHPYGLITCAPLDKIVRINSTSGTTGTPTLYTLTKHDVAVVNEMHARKYWRAGLRPGMVVLQALSLSMFTGGLPLSDGLQHMGLAVVPVGVEGRTRRVLQFAELTKPNVIIATPSFGEYLIEKCPEILGKEARDLGIRYFFCAGEPGGGIPSVRKKLAEGFGAKVFDHTGGGHAFHGISCDMEEYQGMHFVSEDHCILELVDPDTKEPIDIEDGAVGEMVWTFIDWEGGPFMRYLVGDIAEVRTEPCPCGLPGIRFKILGRADDMLIVKGVNVYPSAIKEVVSSFYPETTGYMRIVLDEPGPRVKLPLKVEVEYGQHVKEEEIPHLMERIRTSIKEKLRVNPKLIPLAPETLPRETKKSKLVVVRDGKDR